MSDATYTITVSPNAPPSVVQVATPRAAPSGPGPVNLAQIDPTAVLGLEFTLNGQPVSVTSSGLAGAAANGITFELAQSVPLGTMANILTFIQATFNVTLPDPTNLPPPLSTIITSVMGAEFTVEYFNLFIPPSTSTDGVQYTLNMSVALPTPVSLIPGNDVLQISGAVFGVSNQSAPG
jgi:hypothetical protein